MSKNQAGTLALLSITAFALAFLITGRVWFRADLTRNKAYTISEVSRNLYREIADEVRITYFVSGKLKQAYPLPGEIADLLREYAAYSRGKIRFIERDPARAELLREVEELGIMPQQIQVTERDEITVATVYSGILIEYLDRESVMPVVFSLDTLEYDLSSRIRALVRDEEREIGVIVADAYKQFESEFGLLGGELFLAGFRIRPINPGDEIPESLSALFVLGGAEYLDQAQLYRIDTYISGGGSVLFAVDGVSVDTRETLAARAVNDKGLLAMLANYGAVVRGALALDRPALSISFRLQTGNGTFVQSARYPHWIGVLEQGGNPDHAVTARFRGLDLYWASPIELSPPPGVAGETLFSSTAEAWLQTEMFVTRPDQAHQFEEEAETTRGTKILGASLSGIFPSAFTGQAKPDESLPDQSAQKKPSRIIVVGDSDFAGSMMRINRGEERNLDFLVRAAEWLSSDEDLAAIRGREGPAGRLDRVADPEKRAAIMVFSRAFNTIIIPAAVILTGLFLAWRRRRGAANQRLKPEVYGEGEFR